MAVVLSDNKLGVQLPQSRIVIAAGSHQVGTIGTEGTVPYPALVLLKSGLERESLGLRVGRGRFHLLDFPDPGRVIGAARCELLDIGRK